MRIRTAKKLLTRALVVNAHAPRAGVGTYALVKALRVIGRAWVWRHRKWLPPAMLGGPNDRTLRSTWWDPEERARWSPGRRPRYLADE